MKRLLFLAVCAVLAGGAVAAREPSASARLAEPDDVHAWLDPLVGTWDVEMRVYPGPSTEPFVSKDFKATRAWDLGGRYLIERLSGSMGGGPTSERLAVLGYNALLGRFELTTVDTFEPGQMIYVSDRSATSERIEFTGISVEAGMGPDPRPDGCGTCGSKYRSNPTVPSSGFTSPIPGVTNSCSWNRFSRGQTASVLLKNDASSSMTVTEL